MASYITYLYICNKHQPVAFHVSNRLDITFDQMAKLTGETTDFIRGLTLHEEHGGEATPSFEICQDAIDTDKFLILSVEKKYFTNFKKYLADPESDVKCLHNTFTLAIIKTDDDGTFKDQYEDACEIFLV